jgi:hypothetical protein
MSKIKFKLEQAVGNHRITIENNIMCIWTRAGDDFCDFSLDETEQLADTISTLKHDNEVAASTIRSLEKALED